MSNTNSIATRICVIDYNIVTRVTLHDNFKLYFSNILVDTLATAEEFFSLAEAGVVYSLVIIDGRLVSGTGPSYVPKIRKLCPGIKIIGLPSDIFMQREFELLSVDAVHIKMDSIFRLHDLIRELLKIQ